MPEMHANAWHLTKIILPNGQEMTLSYQRQCFTNQMSHNFIVSEYDVHDTFLHIFPLNYTCSSGDYVTWKHITGKLLSPVYLYEIHTPTCFVAFYNSICNDLQYRDSVYIIRLNELGNCYNMMPYVTNFSNYTGQGLATNHYLNHIHQNLKRYKLDSIVACYSNTRRTVALNYLEENTSRLALKEIVFANNSTYHFKYNNIQQLPHYISFKTDHWGYYNNISSFILSDNDTINYYLKKECNPPYSKYGLLTKMYHPTGAVTEFDYESNDYQKRVAESRWRPLETCLQKEFGGGVRIHKISHYENEDDEQPIITKEYFYTTNYIENPNSQISSGILGERFKYHYSYTEDGESGSTIQRNIFSSNSVLPNCNHISSVCYSEVTEKLSSGGYTVYKFSNYSNILDEKPLNVKQQVQKPYGNYTSKRMDRGLLLSKVQYDSQKQMLYKTNFTYIPNKSIEQFVRSVNWGRYLVCDDAYSCWLEEGFTYKYYTHTMVPETIRDVWYSANGDSIVKTTKNYYNLQYQMPTQIDVMTKTDTISQMVKYPFDLHPWGIQPYRPYSNDFDRLCAKMKSEHYFLPLEVSNYKRGKVVNSTYYNYSEHNGLGQETYYAVDSVSTLGITEPLVNFTPVSLFHKDDRYIVPAKQSCLYNENGNIIEITTDGIPVSYVWGYNDSYVVAKIVGLHYSQVQSIIPAYWFSEFNLSAGPSIGMLSAMQAEIKSHYPLAQCYTYQYNPLYGIISETDPRGQTLFYDYDAMGRLKEVYYKENNSKRVVKKYLYHHKTFSPIQLQ